MDVTDEQLVERYRQGDEQAFVALVDRYMVHLYHFVRQFVSDPAGAEDIVQETFVKAWQSLPRFQVEKRFKTWIFTIAKNTTHDFLKKKKTLPFSLFENSQGENVLENTVSDDEQPDEVLDRESTALELEAKLRLLAPEYQALLRLRYQQDLTLQEIAALLEVSYNTIKSKHTRALAQLKRTFL